MCVCVCVRVGARLHTCAFLCLVRVPEVVMRPSQSPPLGTAVPCFLSEHLACVHPSSAAPDVTLGIDPKEMKI